MLVKESAEMLTLLLKYLQVEEPLIHKLHDLLSQVLLKLLGRIANPKTLVGITEITEDSFDTKNLMPIDQINISPDIVDAMKNCKDVNKSAFRLNYQKHFKAIALHILKKSCYKNDLVRSLKYIGPLHILDVESSQHIMKIARQMPFKVSPTIIDEWSLLKATVQINNLSTYKGRIDDFYVKIFDAVGIDNSPMYPSLSKVIKSVLTISHGQADIERGLSESSLILTDDKTNLSVRALNARLNIKSVIKLFFENDHTLVPIDKNFISSARRAHRSHVLYVEECKRKEAEQKKAEMDKERKKLDEAANIEKIVKEKNSIKQIESVLKEKEKENQRNAKKLLEEANERLKAAIHKKNLSEISLAQGMIEGAKIMIDTEEGKTTEILKLKTTVEKRQSALIENFIKKK